MSITIALDAMGGDIGVPVVVPAALQTLKSRSDVEIILVGQQDVIEAELKRQDIPDQERLHVHHASQVVGMDESPQHSMRHKKDSSLRVAINLVKEGEAQACVSAGNTGALMATARFVLKTLPGIDRPALITAIPNLNGHVHVLDLGTNVDVPADLLLQFGLMGSTLVKHVENKPSPTVGLLNVGVEDIKGNETIRQAAELFKQSPLNYVGFAEGDQIFLGNFDVIVCDGFVGNAVLKSSEGLAQMLFKSIREEFTKNIFNKLAALLIRPALRNIHTRFDHRRYNGATLIGLRGIVIKSHGGADEYSYRHAIDAAIKEAESEVPTRISEELSKIHSGEAA